MTAETMAPPLTVPDGTTVVAPSAMSTLFLIFAVFVPGHMFSWLLEWLWLAVTLAVGSLIVLSRPPGNLLGVPAQLWFALYAVLTLCSVVSVSVAIGANRMPIIARDLAELARLPIYGVFGLIVGALATHWSAAGVDRVLRFLAWFIVVVTAIYLLRPPLLYAFFADFVYAEAKTLFGVGLIRISFPLENPNFLGFLLLFQLVYFTFYRPRAVYILLSIAAVFLTGSRSAWIAAMPILALGFIAALQQYGLRQTGVRTLILLTAPAASLAALVIYWDELTYFSRLAELAEALQGGGVSQVETADIRFQLVQMLFGWIERAPFFGWGPARALGLDVADNQYMSWLVTWGVVGTLLILISLGFICGRLLLAARRRSHLYGAVAIILSVALIIFTGDFMENYRLFFLMLILLEAFYQVSSTPDSALDAEPANGLQDGN